ncbi:tail fiber domain-containing protein [Runella sp.]|uniref:tail fiber domain-containing protein n=1 Tax=Runella sp. TaxID=1960881 RepID=UPI003D0ACC81
MQKLFFIAVLTFIGAAGLAQSILLTPNQIETKQSGAGENIILQGINPPNILSKRQNGTIAAPTAVTSGNDLFSLQAAGYNGTAFSGARSTIRFEAAQNWTTTQNGAKLVFATTENGTTTPIDRMIITDNGRVGVGTDIPQSDFEVAGNGGMGVRTYGNANTFNSHIYGSHASGTVNAPTASTNDQILARFEGHGFNGSYFEEGARIEMRATETWASAENGTEMNFYTTPTNADTPLKRMTITESGVVSVNSKIGINTTTPEYALEVLATSDDAIAVKRFGDAPTFFGVSANGTVSTPTSTLSNDVLARFGARGYDGTAFTNGKARIEMRASANWNAASTGAAMDFITTTSAGTTPAVNMTLSGPGNLGIGRLPTLSYRLEVEGNAYKTLGGGNWDSPSDRRLKKDITYLNSREMLEKVLQLKGANYRWKDEKKGKELQFGFIAQELRDVFPTTVQQHADGYLSATYGDFDPMLVESIKALKELIDEQREMIVQQQAQINELKTVVSAKNDVTTQAGRTKE